MTTSSRTLNAVERACADLVREGRQVTFTAVATATGFSRPTLYRNPAVRALVEHNKQRPDGSMTAVTDEIATLRAVVNTLAERIRSHEEQLRRLRS